MINLRTTLGGMALSLIVVVAAVSPASAQRRWRNRDQGLSTASKVGIIGGGAVAGAVVGGLLKGKTGALIGAAIGGGAGTGAVLIKDRNDNDDRWEGRYRNYDNRRFDNRGVLINRSSSFVNSDYYYRGNEFRNNQLGNGVSNRGCDNRGFRGSSRRR